MFTCSGLEMVSSCARQGCNVWRGCALPCPALPCPALPCSALLSLSRFASQCFVLHFKHCFCPFAAGYTDCEAALCIPAPAVALPCPALLCSALSLLCTALFCISSPAFVQLQLEILVVTQPCGCRHSLKEVVRKVYHVASALQYMHSQQLVHQDLHTGNVLTTLDDRAWQVADFGAASWTHHQGAPVCLTHLM